MQKPKGLRLELGEWWCFQYMRRLLLVKVDPLIVIRDSAARSHMGVIGTRASDPVGTGAHAPPLPYVSLLRRDMQTGQPEPRALLLVAEDEFLVALDLEILLEEKGYGVCGVVPSAEEAVRLAERSSVDLALVDVNLAGGSNGLDAVSAMRERFSVPSIVISGHALMEEAKAAGAIGWIPKPIDAKQLIRLIAYVLERDGGESATERPPRGFLLS